MLILELASNITLRLFLRPFEAVLSFKSLFEGVPEGVKGSYFTWLALFTSRFRGECFRGQGRGQSEAAGGRSRPFLAEAKFDILGLREVI